MSTWFRCPKFPHSFLLPQPLLPSFLGPLDPYILHSTLQTSPASMPLLSALDRVGPVSTGGVGGCVGPTELTHMGQPLALPLLARTSFPTVSGLEERMILVYLPLHSRAK